MDSNDIHEGAHGRIFSFARVLRKFQTPAEKELWRHLRGRKYKGFKFRRQHPVQNYIADFYCCKYKLIIEIDGDYHSQREQESYDQQRTSELTLYGIKVLRFRNQEVLEDLDGVLKRLDLALIPQP